MKPSRNDPCPCGSGKKYKHCCERKEEVRAVNSTPTVSELNTLQALFNSRQYAAVETSARALLDRHPNEPAAWKLLAISLQMQGGNALPAFQKTAELLPADAGAHMNFGNALQAAGQWTAAVQSYQRALVIKPNFAEAHNNLASTFAALGQFEAAAASYRRAIQIKPDFAAAHSGLGGILSSMGQLDEAVASYRRAIKAQPDFTEAHNNLGVVLRNLGLFEQAVSSYRQALKIQPDYAEVHSNLGVALRDLGQLDSAVASFQTALKIHPNDAQTYSNLGLAWHDLGKFDEAMVSYRHALSIDPDYAEALNNLGLTQNAIGQHLDAAISCRQAIKIQPDFVEAYNSLGNSLSNIGNVQEALTSYRNAIQIKPDYFDAHSNLLMAVHYTHLNSPDYLAEARRFGISAAKKVTARYTTWQCVPAPQRLRVGFVSADFHNHPVGYFLESLLTQLDPSSIELIAYTNNPISDELTARIKPFCTAWKPIFGLNDEAAARLIHADGVHVLIDLSGHTAKNRLPVFALKPAPIQVSWLGYFASTGVAEMDYVLADETGVPESHRTHFSESIWHLPHTRLCFTPPNTDLPVAPLPSLSTGRVTFGCFQNLAKVNDEVLAMWGPIFAALPNARLRLTAKQLNDPSVTAQLKQRLQQHGIADTRVTLHSSVSRLDYLAAHAQIDILLDTFPYPGGTTTCEALWMGVPTLTMAGDTLLSRQGASLLTAAGLTDWIATSEDGYVAKAIQFTRDLPKLAALRAGLREQVRTSPLFNAPLFAKHFEDALWGMWENKGMQTINEMTQHD